MLSANISFFGVDGPDGGYGLLWDFVGGFRIMLIVGIVKTIIQASITCLLFQILIIVIITSYIFSLP